MGLLDWIKRTLLNDPVVTVPSSSHQTPPQPQQPQQQQESRASWVFDSHIVTTEAAAGGSGKNPQAISLAWDEDRYGINGQPSWYGMTARDRKETLLQIFLANPWASNCIDTIALYIVSGGFTIEPRVPKPDTSQRDKIEQFLLRVNDDWDFNQYVYDQLTDDLIFGEAFTEFTLRDRAPYRLYPIDCLTMDSEHDKYGRVTRYKQQLSMTSEVNYLNPKTIIRWWNPHKRAKVDPFSPLERIQDAILLDKKMVNWQTRFFAQGGKFDYSIEGIGDRDEADRFLTWWRQNYLGEKNAHVPPITWGSAKLVPNGKGAIDIDFNQGANRQQTIVLSAFHVPPSIACIAESGNRLTDMSDSQRKILQYVACDPRRHRFFEKFNWRLIYPFFGEDYYVSTRYADFRDDETLAKVADMRIRNGSLLIDESRQEAGKEAYPDGAGGVAVIVTTKDVTPVARLKDLEDEQRQTAQIALQTAAANADLAQTKAKQAKEPPQPVPVALQNAPQQNVATQVANGENDEEEEPQSQTNQKGSARGANSHAKSNEGQSVGTPGAVRSQESAPQHTGMMLAFLLDAPTAKKLALPGGEPASDLHITLAYLGDMNDEISDEKLRPHTSPSKIRDAVAQIASHAAPLTGTVGGVGRFFPAETDETPVIALVDVAGLAEFRTKLVQAVAAAGYFIADNHGYTPHITLAYIDADAPMPVEQEPSLPLVLDTVWLCVGDQRIPFKLGGEKPAQQESSVTRPTATTKQQLATTLQSFWLETAKRAAPQVEEGVDPVAAYSFTTAEQAALRDVLASAYAAAHIQAYQRAMATAKLADKTRDEHDAVRQNAQSWASGQVESISATYRSALASALASLSNSKESVEEGLLGGGGARGVPAGVGDWLKGFLGWKAPQVANVTVGSGTDAGTNEALSDLLDEATRPDSDSDPNGVRVRVEPGSSSNDLCAEYAGNDYSLEEAVDLPEFPLHPNCPHEKVVYLTEGGEA